MYVRAQVLSCQKSMKDSHNIFKEPIWLMHGMQYLLINPENLLQRIQTHLHAVANKENSVKNIYLKLIHQSPFGD